MRIKIEYNGSYAVCKVDGKYIHECDSLTQASALQAFYTIEQHLRRERKYEHIQSENRERKD